MRKIDAFAHVLPQPLDYHREDPSHAASDF